MTLETGIENTEMVGTFEFSVGVGGKTVKIFFSIKLYVKRQNNFLCPCLKGLSHDIFNAWLDKCM